MVTTNGATSENLSPWISTGAKSATRGSQLGVDESVGGDCCRRVSQDQGLTLSVEQITGRPRASYALLIVSEAAKPKRNFRLPRRHMDPKPASLEDTAAAGRRWRSPFVRQLTLKGHEIPALPLALALLTCIFILFITGFLIAYGAPIADDYSRGVVGWQNAISYADSGYMHWTGRWASQVIESGLFSAFDLYRSVPLILAFFFALRFLALMCLFRQTLRCSLSGAAFWSMLFVITWLSITPGINESTLWATGAVEYELSLSLALFARAMIARSRWVAAAPLLAVAVTMHELIALVLTGACFSMLWMRRQEPRKVRPLVVLTIATAILTVLVILAPGNFERALYNNPPPPHKLSAVSVSLYTLASSALTWTTSPATVGLLLFVCGTRKKNNREKLLDLIGWPCVVIGLALAIAITFAFYGEPQRIRDLLCFVYLLFLVYAAAWSASYIEVGRHVRIIGLLLFSLGAATSRNVKDMAISAIQAPVWRQALMDRRRTHHFDRISWPRSYYWNDVTSDENDLENKRVAKYLGIASVSCSTCEPSPAAKQK